MSSLISVDEIIEAIAQYKVKYFSEKLREIIRQNMMMTARLTPHFTYLGKFYGKKETRRDKSYPLHSSLQSQMEDYLSEFQPFQTDMKKLSQILKLVLDRCESYQDIRNYLPTAVVNEISSFHPLKDLIPTIDDPTLVFEATPVLRKQYEKVIPLMEAYTALKFIY